MNVVANGERESVGDERDQEDETALRDEELEWKKELDELLRRMIWEDLAADFEDYYMIMGNVRWMLSFGFTGVEN